MATPPFICIYLHFSPSSDFGPFPGFLAARSQLFCFTSDPKKEPKRPPDNRVYVVVRIAVCSWPGRMLTIKLFLTAALLFLTRSRADGAPGSPMGRKLLQHSASSWTGFQRAEGKELPSWLSWEPFGGQLPADAVSNRNAYTNVTEYVCLPKSWHCSIGSYVPSRGPFCTFAFGGLVHDSSEFMVLVNKGRLEALRWVDDSFGDVPENAVEGCESSDIYVGRNRYGLGKVSKEQRALFVAVDGKEVWFKWYQVLTVKTGPAGITISGVLYNVSAAAEHGRDVTVTKTTVKNEGCQGTRRVVTLEEATEVEQDWELDQEIFGSVRGVLEAGLLAFDGTSWEATNVMNVTWLGKASAATPNAEKRISPDVCFAFIPQRPSSKLLSLNQHGGCASRNLSAPGWT
ncbi:natterin-3-like isoform X2 [Lagopus leucura]|uniref:natterin-3-like isoform X2 n=1 Tax=Lagopus leucura TaxID=30410 RepID=UPI001C66F0BF|nr:natterin-3-like isoform X2 [Lagopus leucura]